MSSQNIDELKIEIKKSYTIYKASNDNNLKSYSIVELISLYKKYKKAKNIKEPQKKKIQNIINILNRRLRKIKMSFFEREGEISIKKSEIDSIIRDMHLKTSYDLKENIKYIILGLDLFCKKSFKNTVKPALYNLLTIRYIGDDNTISGEKNKFSVNYNSYIARISCLLDVLLKELVRKYKEELFSISIRGIINPISSIDLDRKDVVLKALEAVVDRDEITILYLIPAEIERFLRNELKEKDELFYKINGSVVEEYDLNHLLHPDKEFRSKIDEIIGEEWSEALYYIFCKDGWNIRNRVYHGYYTSLGLNTLYVWFIFLKFILEIVDRDE
ncbi:MAG: DUF4209 domain-containing protein [Alphaproteobacteria bacterium]|jgi:hypothetical protein|nr:DUF4209 domain-containing protein [Alphaproteobacteria bacterium]